MPNLRCLVPDLLWTVDEPFVLMGFAIGARMTVVRLPGGGLWLHSPLSVDVLREELSSLGGVAALVAPSRTHYFGMRVAVAAFPGAALYAAASTAARVGPPGSVTVLDGDSPPAWGGAIETSAFAGSRLYDEVSFFHAPTRTLILTDLFFNLPPGGGLLTRLPAALMGIGRGPNCSRSFALSLRDRRAARASLDRILSWDFDRVVMSHGAVVESGGKELFRRIFAWLD